jgi:uncharacterized protein (DUF4415 family)
MKEKSQGSRRSLRSDLAKVNAHTIQQDEYDDLPEAAEADLRRGKWHIDSREVSPEQGKGAFREAFKRGRPKSDTPKMATTIRLDADVVAAFRASGRGWQTRVNKALREWLKEHPAA